jgi:hypothetical protein
MKQAIDKRIWISIGIKNPGCNLIMIEDENRTYVQRIERKRADSILNEVTLIGEKEWLRGGGCFAPTVVHSLLELAGTFSDYHFRHENPKKRRRQRGNRTSQV